MNQVERYNFLLISFLICNFTTLIAKPITSFSLNSFNVDKDSNFNSNFALLGDAQIVNNGNFINLTSTLSKSNSIGQIVYKKPLNFLDSKSFSSDFSFRVTSENGDGIAFVIVENYGVFGEGYFGLLGKNDDDVKFVAVEYDFRKESNHVVVNVGGNVSDEVIDLSSIGIVLDNGVLLKSWVDYDASSKRLEVRLAEFGAERPYDALISSFVDLSKMWGDKDVFVGISSSSRGLKQISSLASWRFEVRMVDRSLHSQPLNPEGNFDEVRMVSKSLHSELFSTEMKFDKGRVVSKSLHSEPVDPDMKVGEIGVRVVNRKSCFLSALGAVIFATGCGTLIAFLGLFAWVIFFGRHSNVVPELSMNPVDFKYEKVDVVVDDVFMRSTTS